MGLLAFWYVLDGFQTVVWGSLEKNKICLFIYFILNIYILIVIFSVEIDSTICHYVCHYLKVKQLSVR